MQRATGSCKPVNLGTARRHRALLLCVIFLGTANITGCVDRPTPEPNVTPGAPSSTVAATSKPRPTAAPTTQPVTADEVVLPGGAPTADELVSRVYTSQEELANAILEGLKENDPARLAALQLDRATFERVLYVPSEGKSAEYDEAHREFHWDMAITHSLKGMRNLLYEHGGKDYELLEVTHAKDIKHEHCRQLRSVQLRVRDRETNKEEVVRACTSIADIDGRWLVCGYED